MPDISMCYGETQSAICPRRDDCYRFTAIPNPYRQAYFTTPPFDLTSPELACKEHWSTSPSKPARTAASGYRTQDLVVIKGKSK